MKTTTQPKASGPYLGLTEEEFKRFDTGCHRTWETIASDIFAAAAENDCPRPMRRSEVIEVTLDASYLRHYGGGMGGMRGGTEWTEFYDNRLRPWLDTNYDTPKFKTLMKRVFPFAYYE